MRVPSVIPWPTDNQQLRLWKGKLAKGVNELEDALIRPDVAEEEEDQIRFGEPERRSSLCHGDAVVICTDVARMRNDSKLGGFFTRQAVGSGRCF